jgi:L-2-amino-thiazoline-4-carboxylic acid hydrolase
MDITSNKQPFEITHLQLRGIQAPIAVCLIKEFAKSVGFDKALEIATAAIQADALMAGNAMAKKHGSNTLKDMARLVREVWSKDDAMTVKFLEETDLNLSFNVTRCGYAELYQNMGILEFGYCLSCSRDEPFIQGFNARISLSRTQTIMQGAPYCDFRYVMG